MTTFFKPRGPQKPSIQAPEGIRITQLIQFLRDAQHKLQDEGTEEEAVLVECMADYFEHDYKLGQPLKFTARAIGM